MEKEDLYKRIERLNQIGIALSSEQDKTRLLELILTAAKELTNADAGTLYSLLPTKKLHFEIIRNDTLKFEWTQAAANKAFPTQDIPLYNEEGKPNDHMIVVYAVVHDKTVNIPDAYACDDDFDFSGTQKFDQKTGYHSKSFLTVPMKNHENEVIGVLQLINALNKKTKAIIPFSKDEQNLVESLASQAAVAMTNQALIRELREMFETLVKVLADAIDEKSPVTGRHCRRVPIIAMLLALAVNQDEGPLYKERRFTADELYELELAALLHDCGKVVTPVNVIEKGKKLEGIWDKIALINMRILVLVRDAQLQALQEKLDAVLSQDRGIEQNLRTLFNEIEARSQSKIEDLKETMLFLQKANEGREVTDPEWLQRILEIAKWHLEDVEGKVQPILDEDELHKISVEHGTLTPEERKVIQNHVSMTYKMLKDIPYPKYLRHIPEIAGSHHERIDGKGYPRGLTKDQMSLQARILCIADIFEALTAPDRPYKKPMPLSQALSVMQKLKDEGHIDPDLWDLFMRQKVYLRYAKDNLSPQQIDVS